MSDIFVEIESFDKNEQLSKVEIEIPKDLPRCYYKISKQEFGGFMPMPDYNGHIKFITRVWGYEPNLEVGHALYISNRDFWWMTSVVRNIIDNNDHLLLETSSGSLYKIEPMHIPVDEFLRIRREKKV